MNNYIFQFRNRFCHLFRIALTIIILFCMNNIAHAQQGMIVRISEIDIHPNYLKEYIAILKHEAEASVKIEPGVIAIFPMLQRDNPTQVRILEIYRDQKAYQSHLQTEHFLKYKTTTLHMIKSLKLVDMDALDVETATQLFSKLKSAPQ